jgi:hypothetical protein
VGPTVDQRDLGPDYEVFDRPRHQHLAGARFCLYARRDMHSEATHIWTAQLDLTGMQSASDLDAEAPEPIAKSEGTPDRPSGPIERGEEAVSGGFDEDASESGKLSIG